ncbi:hypothetical protein TNCV_245111 [Trichonephila clavipes]|uniref:Uncharacterized protein n=1 Tax=Trichonephila clavipes TaxID=2585209 RepID=A0A8X6RQ72_TRICX|nr:hypothetical protein TNCV_245111 [Trichonephila clavipes]
MQHKGGFVPKSKDVLVYLHARTIHSGMQLPKLLTATLWKVGNLHLCRFLQAYRGSPNLLIRLATPLGWFIVLSTASIITIFTD